MLRLSTVIASVVVLTVHSMSASAQPDKVAPTEPPAPPVVTPPDPTDPAAVDKQDKQDQKEKDVAKKAELTPIIPSPHDVTRPAFQLYREIDLPILAVGAVFGTARFFRTQPAFCAPLCDKKDLNALDRLTAGYYSTNWQLASNLGVFALGGAAAALLIADEGALPALNDAVVVAEAALSATALSSMLTLAEARPRPFLFGDKAPLSERTSVDAGLSFLSSHTAISFALATSMFMAERRLHPGSHRQYVVLGAGLALGTFIATARVLAGKHFITDVTGGAVVGASLGILIPAMHASPVNVVPVVTDKAAGVGVSATF